MRERYQGNQPTREDKPEGSAFTDQQIENFVRRWARYRKNDFNETRRLIKAAIKNKPSISKDQLFQYISGGMGKGSSHASGIDGQIAERRNYPRQSRLKPQHNVSTSLKSNKKSKPV